MKAFVEHIRAYESFVFGLLLFLLPLGSRYIIGYFGTPPLEWNSVYVHATDFLALVLALLWLLRILWSARRKHFEFSDSEKPGVAEKPFRILLAVFLGAVCLSAVLNYVGVSGAFRAGKFFEFALLFLWIRSAGFRMHAPWVAGILVLAAAAQSAVGVAQFFTQGDLGLQLLGESRLGPGLTGVAKIVVGRLELMRAYGFFPHPNVLAAFLGVSILVLGALFVAHGWRRNPEFVHSPLRHRPEERTMPFRELWRRYFGKRLPEFSLFGAALSVLVPGFLLTFSRAVIGSFLLALAALFVYAVIRWRREESHRVLEFVFLCGAVFFLWSALFSPFLVRRIRVSPIEPAVTERVLYNIAALEMIEAKPWWGVGIGTFTETLPEVLGRGFLVPSRSFPAWILQPAHNMYLLFGAEAGLVGLGAFLLFLFFAARGAFRKGEYPYSLFVLFFLLLVGMFDHFFLTLHQGGLLFWITLGLL